MMSLNDGIIETHRNRIFIFYPWGGELGLGLGCKGGVCGLQINMSRAIDIKEILYFDSINRFPPF